MKSKSTAIMLALAVGIPAVILYNIFLQDKAPTIDPIPGFQEYKSQITGLSGSSYEVFGVLDEGIAVRVNIVSLAPTEDRLEARIQTTNALYDVQSLLGKDLSVSVWNYRSKDPTLDELQGMAFYHALTEQLVFKTADDLRGN